MNEKRIRHKVTSETMMSQISLLTFRYSNSLINIKRITDREHHVFVPHTGLKKSERTFVTRRRRDESDSASFHIQIIAEFSFSYRYQIKIRIVQLKSFRTVTLKVEQVLKILHSTRTSINELVC